MVVRQVGLRGSLALSDSAGDTGQPRWGVVQRSASSTRERSAYDGSRDRSADVSEPERSAAKRFVVAKSKSETISRHLRAPGHALWRSFRISQHFSASERAVETSITSPTWPTHWSRITPLICNSLKWRMSPMRPFQFEILQVQ